jgi:hypothetical protein
VKGVIRRNTYLVIESVGLGEVEYVNLDGLSPCAPPFDPLAVDAEVEPLLVALAVAVQTHQHVVLCVTDLPYEVKVATLEVGVEQKVLLLILLL